MPNFTVMRDGLLADTAIQDAAAWYKSRWPEADPVAFEAHMALLHLNADLKITADHPDQQSGLSRARLNLLRLLLQADGERLLMSNLSEGLGVTPTNITRLVDEMVGDGLVRRERDPDDKRKSWAVLTEDGRSAFDAALPVLAQRTATLWAGLDDQERRMLVHLISKLRLHLLTAFARERLGALGNGSNALT